MTPTDASMLQPKSLGGILAATWRHCVSHSGAAFVAAAAVLLPAVVVFSFSEYVSVNLGMADFQEQAQAGTLNPANFDPRSLLLFAGYVSAAYLALFCCTFLAGAAIGRIVAERAVGRNMGPTAAWDFLVGALGRLLLAAVLITILYVFAASILSVPVGIVAVVSSAASGGAQSAGPSPLITVASIVFIGVPMVILGTYLAPMPSAAAVEARGSAAALVRSFSLVAGNFGRTFLPFLIASTLSGGVAALLGQGGQALLKEPLQGWLGEANGALVASIPGSLAMLLLTPFMYTLQAVLYLDLRARKEEGDFSIDELAIDMGYAPPSETSGEVSVDSSPADDPES